MTFTLEDIVGLNLEDFSRQNVIFGLEVRQIKKQLPTLGITWLVPPCPEHDYYEIVLEPCYGLYGTIRARQIRMSLTPGKPN